MEDVNRRSITRDELRDLLIQAQDLINKLTKVWLSVSDLELKQATIQHIICDSCKGEDDEDISPGQ